MQDSATLIEVVSPLKIHDYEIVSKTAEADVEVGDVVHMTVTAYDSTSKITELSDDIVEAGIAKHLGRKPVRYRHVDPNSNQAALLGEVLDRDFMFPRIRDPETGTTHMEAHVPLELYARTPDHADFLNFMINLHRGKIAELDYTPQGFGFSLGWIENSAEFIPHELSATPKPLCTTCLSHPGTERILNPNIVPGLIAEGCCGKCQQQQNTNQGEQMANDDQNKLDPRDQLILDLRSEVKEKDGSITQFKAQVAEAEGSFDEKFKAQVAESDKKIAELNGELKTRDETISSLESELQLGKTLPVRAKIAEMLDLEGDEAKAKVESLASWTDEQLAEHFTDLSTVSAGRDTPGDNKPVIAEGEDFFTQFQIGTAEAASKTGDDDEKLMREFLGDRYEELYPSTGGSS